MQSLPVLVFLSLLQGCVGTQPFISMSDLPTPPQSQSTKVASVAATSGRSQGVEFRLSDYQWQHRILLVFAPSIGASDYQQQIQIWQADRAGVADRDLKLVEILGTGKNQADGQSISAASADGLRRQFGVSVEEFAVILVGKDGTEKQRSQAPMDLARLYRTINAMPMRQQEMRSRP
ncbi:MAG: DUF4174 domain-containing protein [Trichocoleus desertorum ATA4-8-CV12]|jgi:hypothetical protein|nr:DUF4174 domain-containing protein [Trichocoleus desertorum ATA4-8-CV12]